MLNRWPFLLVQFAVVFCAFHARADMTVKEQLQAKALINLRNADLARQFYGTLSLDDQNNLRAMLDKVESSHNPLVELIPAVEADTSIVLLVQGLYWGEAFEWYEPFFELRKRKFPTYFLKFQNRKPLEQTERDFEKGLKHLVAFFPGKKIHVVGYSAGGALFLKLWKKVYDFPEYKNVTLVTAASPLAGYEAPNWVSPAMSLVLGPVAAKMAYSFEPEFSGQTLERCQHLITTDCSKDFHACEVGRGLRPQRLSHMPCGNDNLMERDSDTHHTVILSAIREALKEEFLDEK